MSALQERDFILRIIKQLAEVLARALKLAAGRKAEEAQAALESGCLTLLGMDYRSLAMVDSRSAAEVLGEGGRVAVFARLVAAMGEVASKAGDETGGTGHRAHALELALEALRLRPGLAEAAELVAELGPRVPLEALAPAYRGGHRG